MNSSYIIFFIIFIILYIEHRNQKIWIKQYIQNRKGRGNTEMLELARRFIDKECIIYTFSSQITGTITEVSDRAIMVENRNCKEAVNLDFVVRIREYPRNKKGKKSVILD